MEIASKMSCCVCKRKATEILHSVVLLAVLLGCYTVCAETTNNDSSVSVKWPLADSSASVGKLFRYHISVDTFDGEIKSYQVFEQNKGILPDWLSFDEGRRLLEGIPSLKNKGQHAMEVVAYGENSPDDKAIDVFTITVKDDSVHISSFKPTSNRNQPKSVNCHAGKPVTVVTIVVDADFDRFYPEDRLNFATKMARHLNLAEDVLKFNPVNGRPTFEASALVAGPGDAKTIEHGGVFTSWLVGCGNVETDHMPVLQRVEDSAKDGSMSRALGHPIVSWHVTNMNTESSRRRNRRGVAATPTPTMSMPPPSKVSDTVMMTRDVPSMIKPTATMVVSSSVAVVDVTPSRAMGGKITPTKVVTTMPASKDVELPRVKCLEDETRQPPWVNAEIESVTINAGEFETRKIAPDTFGACSGRDRINAVDMTLNVFLDTMDDLPKWASYDRKKMQVKLLPMNEDAGEYTFRVTATDNMKKVVQTVLKVTVNALPSGDEAPSVNVVMKLNYDFDEFSRMKKKVSFRNRIGDLIGDRRNVKFTSVKPGSTIVAWTFAMLARDRCEEAKIRINLKSIVYDNMTLTTQAREALREFKVDNVAVKSGGACKGVVFDANASQVFEPPTTTAVPEPEPGQTKSTSSVWVTTVVPAVVIVTILLIALLVACILYRKRRQGKMSPNDQHTFVNKGTPVVFQSELAEKPKDTATQPLILPEDRERQPNPPDYNHADGSHQLHHATPEPEDRQDICDETTNDEVAFIRPMPPVTSIETKAPKHAVQPGISPSPIGP